MASLRPSRIIVHTSASNWGDLWEIDRWHAQRGFKVALPGDPAIWQKLYGKPIGFIHFGYHGLILNGYRTYSSWANKRPNPNDDGFIQPGRPDNVVGAHCSAKGQNALALGVCLISNPGVMAVTRRQWAALVHWCTVKCLKHGISPDRIYQHSDFDKGKPYCASIDMAKLRSDVSAALVVARLAAENAGK